MAFSYHPPKTLPTPKVYGQRRDPKWWRRHDIHSYMHRQRVLVLDSKDARWINRTQPPPPELLGRRMFPALFTYYVHPSTLPTVVPAIMWSTTSLQERCKATTHHWAQCLRPSETLTGEEGGRWSFDRYLYLTGAPIKRKRTGSKGDIGSPTLSNTPPPPK